MTRSVRLVTIAAFAAFGGTVASAAWAQSGTLRGSVVARASGIPLAYSAVEVVGANLERFTTDSGTFILANLPAGDVRLRVRHVGYAPVDTVVTIPAGEMRVVRVELERAAVLLPTVHVTGALCTSPGQSAASDTALAVAFQQLKLNAEQFRLMSQRYPFASVFVQRFGRLIETTLGANPATKPGTPDTLDLTTDVDTTVIRSDGGWKYQPGVVVALDDSRQANGQSAYGVHIPTLGVFADSTFLDNHCFENAGVVTVDEQRLLRIDFRAAARIPTADLDGAMYLDTARFVIRRSRIWLSRPSPQAASYDSVGVETFFDELLPGIPVIALISGRNVLTAEAGARGNILRQLPAGSRSLADVESQRLSRLTFLGATPDGMEGAGGRRRGVTQFNPSAGRMRVLGVYDEDTGTPLPGVRVHESNSGLTAVTSATGTVNLAFVPQEIGVFHLSKPGYAPSIVTAAVARADTVPITIVMKRP